MMDNSQPVVILAFTAKGAQIAGNIKAIIPHSKAYVRPQDARGNLIGRTETLSEWTKNQFQIKRTIVFIGALGIAVRAIAPYLQHKAKDPAVLCIDEQGKYIIPVVSGHLGGANAFAQMLADQLHAQAIITTATDGRNLLAVDEWARQQGYIVENPETIVDISAAILDKQEVGWLADIAVSSQPSGMNGKIDGALGVYVGPRVIAPFQKNLYIRPPVLTIGIGCKRNTSLEKIEQAITRCFQDNHLSLLSVACLASIDCKADEAALLELTKKQKWIFSTHSAQELLKATTEDGFSQSEFVQQTVGVDCVCERAASLYGELIVKKTKYEGITVSVAWDRKDKSIG